MNSKIKGNAFERECAFRLREIFPGCQTSRFMGRLFDDSCGVDLTDTGNFNVQCKAMERTPPYHEILKKMPKGDKTNIVIHKRNNVGCVVVMTFQDFMNLLKNMGGENRSRKRVPTAIGE